MGFVLSFYIFNVLLLIGLIIAGIYFYNKKNWTYVVICSVSTIMNFYNVFKVGPETIDKAFEVYFLTNYVKHVM